jgi:hypothetical protein
MIFVPLAVPRPAAFGHLFPWVGRVIEVLGLDPRVPQGGVLLEVGLLGRRPDVRVPVTIADTGVPPTDAAPLSQVTR